MSDLRSAVRSLLKNPGLTAAAVLSLGLGIGANTTIFAWIQAVLFRPIPVAADPGRIFIAAMESREGQDRGWSYPNYRDFRDRVTLADFVAQDDQSFNIAIDGSAERAWGGLVSGNFFDVMGVKPAAGRLLTQADDVTPGGHPVVVLSYSFWQRRFAGDPGVVGRQLTINNVPLTVIGVAPEHFIGSFLGLASAAWVPMAMQREMMGGNSRLEARGSGWMEALLRLKPGVSREQAQAQVTSVMSQLEQEYRQVNDGRKVKVVTTWEAPFGAPTVLAPILGVLGVLVALVLIIACANVANLLLSKAVSRRREIAVRLSLGASRWRLVRQLLTEAMLLSVLAGVVGVLMAYSTMGLLMAFVPPVDMPIDLGIRMDTTTLTFALVVSMLTGLIFGLVPSLQASSPETVHALKEEGRGSSGGRTNQRLRNGLVVAQVAVCLILLIGATLFLRSFQKAQSMSPGFDAARLAMASVDLFPSGYTPEKVHDFQARAVAAVEAIPGVASASFSSRIPLSLGGNSSMGVGIEGYTPRQNEEINITYIIVGARYFQTMGVPVRQGREFTEQDTSTTPEYLVINEAMANRYWPNGQAVGGKIRIGKSLHEVIGVTADLKYQAINEKPVPQMFLSTAHNTISTSRMVVRTNGDATAIVGPVRDAIRALDPNLPLYDLRTLTEHMKTAVFAQRIVADLLGAMGMLALLLASIGLYGVMAYAVSQRTQEMGIRLALGASPRALLSMVVKQGMGLTSIGLILGLAVALGAFGSVGAVRTLLPGISPLDPITFVAVPIVLAAIALLASWIPARRAGKVDPIVALRYE